MTELDYLKAIYDILQTGFVFLVIFLIWRLCKIAYSYLTMFFGK